jgi:hypothetical protein
MPTQTVVRQGVWVRILSSLYMLPVASGLVVRQLRALALLATSLTHHRVGRSPRNILLQSPSTVTRLLFASGAILVGYIC